MRLTVEMELGGAEFHRDGEDDTHGPVDGLVLARHLESLAARVCEMHTVEVGDGNIIRSLNGERIGEWNIWEG